MNKLNTVFIGRGPNGKIVYDYLRNSKFVNLKLSIIYPKNLKQTRLAEFENNSKIIKSENANKHLSDIKSHNPEIIFVAGWSEILKRELIEIPDMGTQ